MGMEVKLVLMFESVTEQLLIHFNIKVFDQVLWNSAHVRIDFTKKDFEQIIWAELAQVFRAAIKLFKKHETFQTYLQ